MEIFDRADEVINVLLYLQRFYLISATQLNCCSDWISVFYRVSLGNNRTSYFNNWRKEGNHRRLAVVYKLYFQVISLRRGRGLSLPLIEKHFLHIFFSLSSVSFSLIEILSDPASSSMKFSGLEEFRSGRTIVLRQPELLALKELIVSWVPNLKS